MSLYSAIASTFSNQELAMAIEYNSDDPDSAILRILKREKMSRQFFSDPEDGA